MSPLVSIIIPTYNRVEFLAESIDSVLAQDFSPFEVIVVDDGSTDATPRLLDSYGDRIVRLRQENQGVAAATMAGVHIARAPLIALHDSDDRMLPGRLHVQHSFLMDHREVDAVAGNMIFEDSEPTNYLRSLGVKFNEQEHAILQSPYEQIVTRNFMANSASCLRRDRFLEAGGYDLSYHAVQDGEFWLRAARTWTFACLDYPCTWVRIHAGSLSKSAVAIESKVRLYERELSSGDLVSAPLKSLISRRLMFLTRECVKLNVNSDAEIEWRETVRRAARHLPLRTRVAIYLATRLPPMFTRWLC